MVKCLFLQGSVCWRIWWWRNWVVHGDGDGVCEDLIEWASHFLEGYQVLQMPWTKLSHTHVDSWVAPSPPFIKINFDVGFFELEKYQVAMIARDNDGNCVGWLIRRLCGQPPVVVGEARAAFEGISFALTMGWKEVMLEGDKSEVVAAIQNRMEDSLLLFGALISSINSSLLSFIRC